MHPTIKHEGFRFESENAVEARSEVFIAEGATELSAETAAGDIMTWTLRVENRDRLKVWAHSTCGSGGNHHVRVQ
jgi:hypothetical protein